MQKCKTKKQPFLQKCKTKKQLYLQKCKTKEFGSVIDKRALYVKGTMSKGQRN